VFDADRVVAFPSLSLASGAVKGWDRRNAYTFSLLESGRRHYGFDIDTAFEELPESAREVLLRGSGSEEIEFVYEAEGARGKTRQVKRKHPFEGILPNLERRFKETDSVAVREDLMRYQSAKPCPDCHGARLRVEARNVFLVDAAAAPASRSSASSTSPCARASPGSRSSASQGAKAEIADKVIREICSRLKFLNDVGLQYLSLDRSAETLSGGEAQRIRLASQIGSGLTGVMYVLDEPSIGLHQRDNERLIGTLRHLRDLGNSVLVGRARRGGDPRRRPRDRHGPGRRRPRRPGDGRGHAGRGRGRGRVADRAATSRTALTIAGARAPAGAAADAWFRIEGARGNNLKNVSVALPVGPLHLRHRASRLGQVDAGQRHALRRRRQNLYNSHAEPSRTTPSPASTRSTR
jgi:excinuclease ABC subunit A